MDLLDRLATSLHISYEISIVKDNKYGEPVLNNGTEWDGMIGEILRGVCLLCRTMGDSLEERGGRFHLAIFITSNHCQKHENAKE